LRVVTTQSGKRWISLGGRYNKRLTNVPKAKDVPRR